MDMNETRDYRTEDEIPCEDVHLQQRRKEKARQKLLSIFLERYVMKELRQGRELCVRLLQQILDVKIRVFERERELGARIDSDMVSSEYRTGTFSRLPRRNKIVMPCRVEPNLPYELLFLDDLCEVSQSHSLAILDDVKGMTRALKLAVNAKIQHHRQLDLIKTLGSCKARRLEKICERNLKALSYETGIIYLFLFLRCKCAFIPRMPIRVDRDFSRAKCGAFHATCSQIWPNVPGLVILQNFLTALQIFLQILTRQILWWTVYFVIALTGA